MQHKTTLGDMARMVIDRMVSSPLNSKDGINLSLDTPLKNCPGLNILRLGGLRQYFGRNVTEYLGQNSSKYSRIDTIVKRYTCGSGRGISLVGIDPYNL